MPHRSLPFLDESSFEAHLAAESHMPVNFLLLVSALEKGWQIEEPVYIQLDQTHVVPEVFLFFLQRGDDSSLQLLTVKACPDIEAFITAEQLEVKVHLDGLLDVCPYAPSTWIQ